MHASGPRRGCVQVPSATSGGHGPREPADRPLQALGPVHVGLPSEPLASQPGVGAASAGVVDRTFDEPDAGGGTGDLDDAAGEVEHGDLLAAADVDRAAFTGGGQGEDAVDGVVDVAQRPGLAAVAG